MNPRFRPPSAAAKARRAARGGMNDTEAAFAEHLRKRCERNEFLSYGFQQRSLPLAAGASYTPDFVVQENDLSVTYYEVRGAKHTTPSKHFPLGSIVPICTTAARVRIKVAASLYPKRRFVMVWPADRHMFSWMERDYSAPARKGGAK